MADIEKKRTEGLPEPPPEIVVAPPKVKFDWKRVLFILIGLGLFLWIYFMPAWPDAIDPGGKHFALSPQGKGAIALFLLAGTWWIFEVIPIGVTAIAIGVFQAIFAIRSAKDAFRDFMDPSVMFIFASVVVGLAFTKSGLTKRLGIQDAAGGGRKNEHDCPGSPCSNSRACTFHGSYCSSSHCIPDTSCS